MILVHAVAEPAEAPSLPARSLPSSLRDERGDLWVLDRKQGVVRRQSPEVTAAQRELYTLEDDRGERDWSVESALANFVDGPGQHALRVLDEGGKLNGEDAGKLAIFVAALYVRTPAFLEQHRQLAEQMRDTA